MSLFKASSARKGLHVVELLVKGSPWKPANITDYCQGYCLLSATQ